MLTQMKFKHWCIGALLVTSSLLLASCSESVQEPTVTPPVVTPEPEPVKEETPVEPVYAYSAPLTGLGSDEPVKQRPLAVMINNAPAARPQSGLSGADIVYEVLAEGGITRLVAIFQSGGRDVNIGPVRSIRPYLIELAESYNALPIHAGGSNDAYAIFQRQGKQHLDEITNAGTSFWRSKDRKAPHNLYTDLDKLVVGAEKRGYPVEAEAPAYTFDDPKTHQIAGEEATALDIRFLLNSYRVSYTYDAEQGLYKRMINGKPHVDLNNNEQLTATNLIVLSTNHRVLDDVGRLAVDLDRGGEAAIFQQGRMIQGTWRHNKGDSIRFDVDGKEWPLLPGKTYIHIVPTDNNGVSGHITITEPAAASTDSTDSKDSNGTKDTKDTKNSSD